MLESLIGKVNMKRLILSVIVMFVFIFASDFVIHSLLLGKTYKELAHLWRPEAELVSFMPWMMLGSFSWRSSTFFSSSAATRARGSPRGYASVSFSSDRIL